MHFTFFDFCAGIGAGHIALKNLGGQCAGFSEINKKSILTYREIHTVDESTLKNWGDLTKIDTQKLPDFDVMIGGFPCQTFSIVGQRKGMKDERGQIIFSLVKILKEKNIKYFLLENVKGLVNHDKGETIKKVELLLNEAGYNVSWRVLKSSDYGIPQIRERVYFVGVKKDLVGSDFEFYFPEPIKNKKTLDTFLIDNNSEFIFDKHSKGWDTFQKYLNNKYNAGKYDLDELLKSNYWVLDTRQSDLRIYREDCPTLRTGRHGILYIKNGKLRKLSGMESLLLQGFPIEQAQKAKTASQTDLLAQTGNAFTVNVIEEIAKEMIYQMPFPNKDIQYSRQRSIPQQKKLNLTIPQYEYSR